MAVVFPGLPFPPPASAIQLVGDCVMLFGLLFKIALNTAKCNWVS